MSKIRFAVEEGIQKRFDQWLKDNGMWYESTIMYKVPNASFRIYTVRYAFMNYEAIANLIEKKTDRTSE